jgi:hypothetical protein
MLIANRSSDHHQRIWVRSTELYEDLLLEVRALAATRERAIQTLITDDERKANLLADAERERLIVRLEMFSHPEVKAAFERYLNAHWKWIACDQASAAAGLSPTEYRCCSVAACLFASNSSSFGSVTSPRSGS